MNHPQLDVASVIGALSGIIDPETGLNIVDLGIIYGASVSPEDVHVTLTMTSAASPFGVALLRMTQEAVENLAADRRVIIRLAWDPPWDRGMISRPNR